APVACLLCDKKLKFKGISVHIHEHFSYFPYRCNDCDFESSQASELEYHIYLTDHNGAKSIDQYKQQEVEDKFN
ncbi:hypothetical protein PENTCL1PPCAC_20026, partial [Pristionchus entomophagus]